MKKSELMDVYEDVRQISRLLDRADDIFRTLPEEIQEAIRVYHDDSTNLKHLLYYGWQNAHEIVEDWVNVVSEIEVIEVD